ncbi:MAG: peptide deformylase [Oscillospiraceae bacterium]|nr:peptide deformylase [Oscillospiraceae bacterium]
MALRNIVKEGDSVLTKKCRQVTDFNPRLHQLIDDMRETLLNADGVGLAAPQVGVLRRVVVVLDINKEAEKPEDQLIELVNPRIIETSGEQYGAEGCLSVPGIYGMVARPEKVTVRAQDRYGEEFEVTGTGITARCFCHELDHLDGHLFKEFADRLLTAEELEELEKEEAGQ